MLHLCWNRTVVFSFSLTAASKWRGAILLSKGISARYLRRTHTSPHTSLCKKEKCSGDNRELLNWRRTLNEQKNMGIFKSPKNNSISRPPSLCNSENTLERCMFWTCAICEALGMANCSLAGFRPRFRQKILSITLSREGNAFSSDRHFEHSQCPSNLLNVMEHSLYVMIVQSLWWIKQWTLYSKICSCTRMERIHTYICIPNVDSTFNQQISCPVRGWRGASWRTGRGSFLHPCCWMQVLMPLLMTITMLLTLPCWCI